MRFNQAALSTVDPAWAWARFEPNAERPWSRELAAHLYRRAAFAANWTQLEESLAVGPEATVEGLLTGAPGTAEFYERVEASIRALLASGNAQHLPAWWLYVMLQSPHPLQEKLTLFWHGHFATSAAKVTDVKLMHDQHALLRRHALGNFGPLLLESSRDPAMLLWLDAANNRKAQPNENFAREVMELFSLGLGNYTEQDIQQAARAFTGWEVRVGRFRMNRPQHDAGEKTVLGQTGAWNGEDVIRILLEQPATGRFLVRKLCRYLVSETETPPDALVEPLAAEFTARKHDIGWLVGTILRSNLFYSPLAVRQKVKAPVDFAIGLLRALEGTTNSYSLADDLRDLGQAVFFPPNVKGWDGGAEWINSATLLSRANLVWALASGTDGRYGDKAPLPPLVSRHLPRGGAGETARWFAELLLAAPVSDEVQVQLAALAGDSAGGEQQRLARIVQAIATLPEFQLA